LYPHPPSFAYSYTGYQQLNGVSMMFIMRPGTLILILYHFSGTRVLLNYAEAKAELGTLTNEEWALTIGKLRTRAGITGGLTTKPTVADPYLTAKYFPDITDL